MSSKGILKSKTGCITCRIRKVKCDEKKPSCKRCISTGRTCDGYRSNFRVSMAPGFTAVTTTAALVPAQNAPSPAFSMLSIYQPREVDMSYPSVAQIQHLAMRFTIKPAAPINTNYGAGISYEQEAQAVLYANSEPAIYHALASVTALRKVYETVTDPNTCCISTKSPDVARGLSEYTNALRTLCITISTNIAGASRYSLICCQMFITIELALDDFTAAAQHFIRGLRIMYQSVSRPYYLDTTGTQVVPAQATDMPLIDLFVLKLFMTPCPGGLTNDFVATSDGRFPPDNTHKYNMGVSAIKESSRNLAEMLKSIVSFLHDVANISKTNPNTHLLHDRLAILANLKHWKEKFVPISQAEEFQSSPWVRLGLAFSLFCCVTSQAIVTLATRPPGSEVKNVEPLFEELLQIAGGICGIKRELNYEGTYLGTFQVGLV
ncbi:unnamed protein product [Periconia digitata]|uniref:Zn(2)-C6 fungal-type domain-containing protein n=1 Tax=Periconia digitata TaxID=1303443 RepID=A0A9W4UG33_9PLEO|nr:unnamed protein product [Periconia digitata]